MRSIHRHPGSLLAAFLLLALLGIALWNHLAVQVPVNRILLSDERNAGIEAWARFGRYIQSDVLVFDLRRLGEDTHEVDVFRVLLQLAAAFQDRRFESVRLAHRGTPKFVLDGGFFHWLGGQYGVKNPILFMAEVPRHLRRPDGAIAFPALPNDPDAVTGRELEGFDAFHREWYLADLDRGHGGS